MTGNFSAISLFPKITPRDADLSETLKNTTLDKENQADFSMTTLVRPGKL